ncbi:Ras-related protein [Wickerhamomyces ciferrii]|uniref:Ras-related protein n=1 Tax=Wickerhamomyces ciferrii (strain ATCC 14091 / BCRC 22168 / CBS 111 / JCM 3599 / NBRC 0793 / NRRL Y-1031 F-60-10) TaxID=1206466 RepID=K0KZ55_WICCF|nr:Ras-related protein [Wickerhamomyces ciferrii]CCH46393.1 Ras-related protein [Wickerhamomyces ciferrii]
MVKETIKICVLGDEGVGKSSITLQYTQAHFPLDFDPTIEDIYSKDLTVDGKRYTLQILDTAIQDEYSPLKDVQFEQADGFVVVFRVDSTESFDSVANNYRHIKRIHGDIPPVVLLGNKCDLETERLIRVDEAEGLAKELSLSKYFDVSAKNNYNIKDAFNYLTNSIIQRKTQIETQILKPELLKQSTDNTNSSNGSSTTGKTTGNSSQSKLSDSTTSSKPISRIERASTFTINTSDHKLSSTDGLQEHVPKEEDHELLESDEKSVNGPSQDKLSKSISSTEITRDIPHNTTTTQRNSQNKKSKEDGGNKCCIIM